MTLAELLPHNTSIQGSASSGLTFTFQDVRTVQEADAAIKALELLKLLLQQTEEA